MYGLPYSNSSSCIHSVQLRELIIILKDDATVAFSRDKFYGHFILDPHLCLQNNRILSNLVSTLFLYPVKDWKVTICSLYYKGF